MIYQKILKELKDRCSARNEEIQFTDAQLRTKFKKCVSDCKFAALTIKTGTGIKRFQDEKGFGSWFNKLFALVETRDSCNPEKAVEPSATTKPIDESDTEDLNDGENIFVPIKSTKKKSSKRDTVCEALDLIKQTIVNDPTKDMIALMREELQKSREHETKLVERLLSANNNPPQQQIYAATQISQHQAYWQSQVPVEYDSQTQHTSSRSHGYGVPHGNIGPSFINPWQEESHTRFYRSVSPTSIRPHSSSSSSCRSSTSSMSSDEHGLEEKSYHKL